MSDEPASLNAAWTWGVLNSKRLNIDWIQYSSEAAAYTASFGHRRSRVLFSPSGTPLQVIEKGDGHSVAAIVSAYEEGRRSMADMAAAREAVEAGRLPFVGPQRAGVKQWLVKSSMKAFFHRQTISFFACQPLRGHSICYWDAANSPGVRGVVALTLDDAPCRFRGQASSKVQEVRELLKEFGAKATFMVVGSFVESHEQDLVQLLMDGNELGNHGWLDKPYDKDTPEAFAEAVDACSAKITAVQAEAGLTQDVRWFRAPHGRYTREMHAVLQRKHLRNVMCDTYASCPVVEDGAFIGEFLSQHAEPGGIVLIHMPEVATRQWCLKGLRILLEGLARRGLKAVTVSELEALAESHA
eukprot:CAMPEP_0178426522 /NCGR_PEP_ID=MMETSP0689_2-20121128/29277_1 /TAXON_ID=160604 /ORGANISM="Amphidinium massartii, Strain CS-259" /LENGTH=355 /DNA_ID=CAMNT_0020048209 /DNA_START=61 /DNA_END=1124 /DNA_ORIENTATION=+